MILIFGDGFIIGNEGQLVSQMMQGLHSRKLTWKPKRSPIKITVLLKGAYMGFHVSLGETTAGKEYGR